MRPALVLAMLGPVLAMANPADGLDRKIEVQTADSSLPPGGGADRANDGAVALAANRDTPTTSGNPLWSIPLSALGATRERPLFSASRRAPNVASPTALSPPEQPPPPPVASAPERPPLSLLGTIVGSESSVALLKEAGSQAVLHLHVGEENSGWRVQGISLHSIVVEKGGQPFTLDLPKPGDSLPAPDAPGADQ
jgi:hypothetical protein